jgi:hypothetical protein
MRGVLESSIQSASILENSKYESLLKEVEKQVDKKMLLNKDGLSLGAK